MVGIEKIIERLEAEANAEIDQIGNDTKAKCKEIAAGYSSEAIAEYEKRVESGKKNADAYADRIVSGAEMDGKKNVLAFKQEVLEEAFQKGAQKIRELPQDEYVAFAADLAAKGAESGNEQVIFCEADKAIAAEIVSKANAALGAKGNLTVSDETRDFLGGVVLKKGDVETDCTIETLITLSRDGMASQVASLLFG